MTEGPQSHLSVRADTEAMPRVRTFVEAFADHNGIAEDDRARILVIVEELVTNVVKYGFPKGAEPGSAEVALGLDRDHLSMTISDDGGAFDPFAQAEPDLEAPIEERSIGRLGLPIVKALTDRQVYRRENGRNIIELGRRVALRAERP